MYYIGIDPSLNEPGFALLIPNKQIITNRLNNRGKELEKYTKLGIESYKILKDFSSVIPSGNKVFVGIEYPNYQDSLKGKKCIETGSLIKLAISAGLILDQVFKLQIIHEHYLTIQIKLISPIEWKGQVPKKITKDRMKKKYGNLKDFSFLSDDEVDAIGIADYLYETYGNQSVPSKETT
jgi:hypothetical protein